MKKIILVFFVILFASMLYAQKTASTLLWKISGNGLEKPSYLYGTMHLTDERIFNLGDSVYAAIEKADGFAIELDPENFTALIIDEAKRSLQQGKLLKEMLNDKTFKRYGKALAKKLNKNENEITTADVIREKNKWVEESLRTGKMQTFLDAYLFDIARRQGKWTGGIEDISDQAGALDYLFDETDVQQLAVDDNSGGYDALPAEQLIKIYIAGDLHAIDSLSGLSDSAFNDVLLIKRNKKMAMRMDSMSHERTMVFAVGAAHLPGTAGVITLLRQKGYTLTPVFSSKKIKPTDYKVASIELPWHDVTDEAGLYKASMPGKAGDMTMYGIVNMKMYFDIFSSTLYMATAMQTPYSETMADSILGTLSEYYFGVDDYKKGKPVLLNGIQGREFTSLKSKDNYAHGYLVFKDGIMYLAIGLSVKKDSAASPSINRFLQSFSINKPRKEQNRNYYTYADVLHGYALDLPGKPKPYDEITSPGKDSSIRRQLNIVADPSSGAYLFFGVNEATKGYYIENDSTNLLSIRQSQSSKFSELTIDTTYIVSGRRVLELGGMMSEAPLMMKACYESRGNRWYALVAMYNPNKPHPVVNHFFESFRILDYPPSLWRESETPDKVFTTWAPAPFEYNKVLSQYDADTVYSYECYDSIRANNYIVANGKFSKYYWQLSDSIFWKKIIKDVVGYEDSLISQKIISNGDAKGYELLIGQQGAGNLKRKRMLLNNGELYSISTLQPLSDIYSGDNNRLFEEFRFGDYHSSEQLFISKAEVLIKDLSSRDSTVHTEAKYGLRNAPFSVKELPLLHDAMLKDYDEPDNQYNNTNKLIQEAVIRLADSTSLDFAKENYTAATDKNKMLLLGIMASFPSDKTYRHISELLIKQKPATPPDYTFNNAFSDSAQLAATVFPDLLPLLRDSLWMPSLLKLANKLSDSNLISIQLLEPYHQHIFKLAQKQYNKLKKDVDAYDNYNYTLIDILEKINNTASNQMLQKWSTLKGNFVQFNAATALLRNKQTLNPLTIKDLAQHKYTRTELYDTLIAYKKQALYPKQFLNQKSFAESYAFTAGADDDEPTGITYITQKTIRFKGRDSRFFFFKITYGEEGDEYYSLACAGPFNLNTADISAGQAMGDLYYDDDFDSTDLSGQMDALIKQMEEWYEWKDEETKKK